MRLLHIFRSRALLWTRCGERAIAHAAILTLGEAQHPAFWLPGARYRDAVICTACASRRR